jgi:hypothetical protein
MAEKLMDGKVCPNHPEVPAVSRCTTCFKPLCQECAIVKENLDFCSDQCSTNHFTTNASIGAGLARDAAAKRRARIRRMILFLALLLVVFGFVFYWQTSMSDEDKAKIKKMGTEAVDKTKKLAD